MRKWLAKISLHFLFWLLVISYFAWGFGLTTNYRRSFINAALYLPGFLLIAYSLLYFLIPRYLIARKYFSFFTGLAVVVAICRLYAWLVGFSIVSNSILSGMTLETGQAVLPFVHVAGIVISIRLLQYWYQQKEQTVKAERQAMEEKQQKLVAELQLLKAQVHPHFLFNTLNNLYSLTLEQSSRAPEIVLKLSGLLRFMIYESDVPFIALGKEIALLHEYIDLEQLRYGSRLDISMTIKGEINDKIIAPLLLLPLVENAFKHGTSTQVDQCWISFDLYVTEERMIFKLVNSKDADSGAAGLVNGELRYGGKGLQNLRKRLALLYGNDYILEVSEDWDVFIVNLTLPIDKKHIYDLEMSVGG